MAEAISDRSHPGPGTGVELMAKSLGVPSKDLKLRIKLLVHGKKPKKTGQKRATKYFSA